MQIIQLNPFPYLTYRQITTGEEVEVNSQELVKPENKQFWSPNPETGKPDWEIVSDKTRTEVIDPIVLLRFNILITMTC